jgi:hypothetical protein
MGPPKVHILDFPTEVLSDIFDYLTPRPKTLESFVRDYSDIFAVRRTCRTFRAIGSTLRLWYDDDFDLSDVVRGVLPLDDGRIDVTDLEIGGRQLFACLAKDKVLLETMSRKQHWSFRTVPSLIQHTDTIPNFRTTITDLSYEVYDSWQEPGALPQVSINDALDHLGILPNLTSLDITTEGDKISLNQIVVTCPSLKKLEFYDNGWYSGSLSGLRSLEKLVVYDHELPKKTGPRQHLLPIDSALSLTDLRIFARGTRNNVYHSKHLLNFINLTKLTVDPLCARMCKTIISANFSHLRKFAAVIHNDADISLDNMLQLLQSRSLNSLQELFFLVEPERCEFSPEPNGYLQIITTITTHLSNLEDLQLTTGINTAWCELFSKLCNLKSIAWVCSEEECIDCTDMFTVPVGDYMTDDQLKDMASLVKEKLNSVFEEFVEKPSVYVKILSEDIYEQWDELFEDNDG